MQFLDSGLPAPSMRVDAVVLGSVESPRMWPYDLALGRTDSSASSPESSAR